MPASVATVLKASSPATSVCQEVGHWVGWRSTSPGNVTRLQLSRKGQDVSKHAGEDATPGTGVAVTVVPPASAVCSCAGSSTRRLELATCNLQQKNNHEYQYYSN